MGLHFMLLLSIYVLYSNVTYIYAVSCLVKIKLFQINTWKQHKFKWKAGVVNEVFLFAIYWPRVSCPMLNPLSALVRPLEKF